MTNSVLDTSNSSPPNDKDKNVLNLIFGDRTCIDDPFTKIIWYLGLAILATIAFLALSTTTMLNYTNDLLIRTILFFVIILLLDWAFNNWRKTQPICGQN